MILLQVICTIWTCLFIPLLNAEEFVPKVTETLSEYSFSLKSFDDSNSLIRLDNRVVWMSFDSGENWEAVKEIEGHIVELTVDPLHGQDRAFASVFLSPKFYVTDDHGKSWRALTIPISENCRLGTTCSIATHPTEKKYLIVDCPCFITDNSFFQIQNEIYFTNDGESFYKIEPSLKKKEDDHITSSSCNFVKSSKDSDIEGNDASILCLFSNHGYDSDRHLSAAYTQLALSTDGGKTFKKFDEFNDKVIYQYKILKSHIIVSTQDDRYNEMSPMDIWISNDASTFQKAHLPAQVRHVDMYGIYEDSIGRIIIPISTIFTDEKTTNQISQRFSYQIRKG
ncbi:AAC_HP2_G0046380.mRNA.1.CDS.1 [Saccharomyces cerevisiae]|nr:AAC_HP2_G0046380.mRNA.1.CDS.1 [Saccharomyces cerevisiae]CAI6749267.1 AAC_HP2_G0046380.mRNA.1.CDS.1 [Saccharomyces cerevisiae]